MHTCAQNEHMWKRRVLRAGGVQRATRPLRGQKPRCVPRLPAGGSRPHGHAPHEPQVPTVRASGWTLPPGPGEPSQDSWWVATEARWRRKEQRALGAVSSFQGHATGVGGQLRAWEELWRAPALGECGCGHARFCTRAVTPRGPGLLPHLGLQCSASQAQAPSAGEHMLLGPGRRSPHGGRDGRRPPAAGPGVKRGSAGGSLTPGVRVMAQGQGP